MHARPACACAPSRSPTRSTTSSPTHDRVFVVEQNRDAQLRTLLVNECEHRPGASWCRSCTTTARRSPRASSPTRSPTHVDALQVAPLRRGRAMTYHRQAEAAPPRPADERARLHPPRLRGRDLDAVRRLRPRFDHARRSSRPASSCDLPPHRVAKLSGIGCSSKTPTYFLGTSHGFNSVHGRMPSVLTGANLANRDLIYLGVSGDGDSRLDRPRPVRPLRCAAASTWSTSSRTTACTA